MVPGSMTDKEVQDFCQHIQQLVMHAGHALGDAKRGAPRRYAQSFEDMMVATRTYYRAAKRFEEAVHGLQESHD